MTPDTTLFFVTFDSHGFRLWVESPTRSSLGDFDGLGEAMVLRGDPGLEMPANGDPLPVILTPKGPVTA
jgi:hypothetical protein